MKKQPTLHPAGAVRISKSLLILTFALFSTAGFAQKDVEISEPDHYKIADMDSEPWLLECDASYSAMALPVKKKDRTRNRFG